MQWFLNFNPATSIELSDRGLAYGDGLFETLSARDGVISNLSLHLSRLERGFKRLGFKVDTSEIVKLAGFLSDQAARFESVGFKVMVTRGSGGRGYLPPASANYSWLVGVFDLPDYSAAQSQGISLTHIPVQTSINRNIAGLKHLNRLENVLAKQMLPDGYFEAVLSDANGKMVECVQSNLFWVKNGELFTPLLSTSGVQGTMRHAVIQAHLGVVNIVQEDILTLSDADEIFITNALSGILPVVQFNDRELSVGPICRSLRERLVNSHEIN